MAWVINGAHSELQFAAKHLMISTVRRRFNTFTGTIDASSLVTCEERRDTHLRSSDFLDVENAQIRLPLVESVQRIMVRAEVRRRRVAARRSIEHLAQRHAVDDAAVHAKTHDAPRPLVHRDEHPVRVEHRRFAPK